MSWIANCHSSEFSLVTQYVFEIGYQEDKVMPLYEKNIALLGIISPKKKRKKKQKTPNFKLTKEYYWYYWDFCC